MKVVTTWAKEHLKLESVNSLFVTDCVQFLFKFHTASEHFGSHGCHLTELICCLFGSWDRGTVARYMKLSLLVNRTGHWITL